jgi:hypothetical protein
LSSRSCEVEPRVSSFHRKYFLFHLETRLGQTSSLTCPHTTGYIFFSGPPFSWFCVGEGKRYLRFNTHLAKFQDFDFYPFVIIAVSGLFVGSGEFLYFLLTSDRYFKDVQNFILESFRLSGLHKRDQKSQRTRY